MSKLKPGGITPAVILVNPKYAHNVGGALRACSSFGMRQLWYTGDRIEGDLALKGRLPREERMKGYKDVDLCACDYPFERFKPGTRFVAVEVRDNSENLIMFAHPQNAVYVFGPEDGGLSRVQLQFCSSFVVIPTAHCLNLAAAVNIVLYDRQLKRVLAGCEPEVNGLREHRGLLDM